MAVMRPATQSARARHGDRVQFGNVECVLVDAQGKARGGRVDRQKLMFGLAVIGGGGAAADVPTHGRGPGSRAG